jgi:hypothetical protein
MPSSPALQLFWLLVLSIPVACVARTVVFEEVFREPREWCQARSKTCGHLLQRKFFYLFTCEYCFSHYVTMGFLALTGFRLLIDDWRGVVIAFFAVVFVANLYLNLYARLRVDIQLAKTETKRTERELVQGPPGEDGDQRRPMPTDSVATGRPAAADWSGGTRAL